MNLKITPEMKNSAKTVAKKLAGKPLLYGSKAIGVVATASVLYDAHVNGRENAIAKDNTDTANRIYRQFDNYLKSDSGSATIAKMKNSWFEIQRAFPFDHSTSKILGYLGGFGMTIAQNIHVVALSALATLCPNQTVSKVAGSMVALYGAKVVADEVLINKSDEKLMV